MTLKPRLEKLEAPLENRWREVWESYYDVCLAPTEPLLDSLEVATQNAAIAFGSDDERAARGAITTLRTQLELDTAWIAWAYVDTPDDESEPNYAQWPTTLPKPPEEMPGAMARLETYQPEGVADNFAAFALRFAIIHARAHREYLVQHSEKP